MAWVLNVERGIAEIEPTCDGWRRYEYDGSVTLSVAVMFNG